MIEAGSGILGYALIVIFLVLISAFFSASETGLTAVSRAMLLRLEQQGNKRAKMASKLKKDKDNLIGAILLGNNLVNILASAIATGAAIEMLGSDGVAYATAIVTVLVLVFGEVMPKTYAINHPDRVALFVAPIFIVLVKILSPVTRVVEWIVRILLRVIGAGQNPTSLVSAAEVIRGTIELHSQEGEIVKQERDMLGSVLDLSQRTVEEVMIHRRNIHSINADQPPEAIVAQVLGSLHTRLPLWQGNPDNIIGVLHVKDVIQAIQATEGDTLRFNVREVAREPWFVPESTSLGDQLQLFRSKHNHLALVVDEYGALLGLLTLEDIIEEIIGRVGGEMPGKHPGVEQDAEGYWRIKGAMPLRDLNRELEWSLPEDDASTLAGLIMHEAERIPETGETFLFHGYAFEIAGRDGNQITLVRAKPLESQKGEEAAGE